MGNQAFYHWIVEDSVVARRNRLAWDVVTMNSAGALATQDMPEH